MDPIGVNTGRNSRVAGRPRGGAPRWSPSHGRCTAAAVDWIATASPRPSRRSTPASAPCRP